MILVLALLPVALGCSTTVKSVALSDDATYFWLGSTSSSVKSIYSVSDEQVTLHVRFHTNFVGSALRFTVDWIAPDGSVYLSDPVGIGHTS